ncbi:alpha/beta fold hydrolase [Georgenia deserti]|uniref:Alpha/beta fold hydrolase n=1 Tax=Georgenia deserti TaxID=2093781 RepID=A0ABW4L3I0_9MICO
METTARLSEITMNYRDEGTGPLVLLLHGWPQTSFCWRHVVPALAEHYRVVAPDLRGYGRSDRPSGGYTKRRMAQDLRELADHLGADRVRVVGHDRGARVGHRFALDHPGLVTRLTVLDVAPTLHMFEAGTTATAKNYWHWLFHEQPDLPELLVGAAIEPYLRHFFHAWAFQRARIADGLAHYVEAFTQPGALRAGFDDYRATPDDLADDRADRDAGRTVQIPVQVLWGDRGLAAGTASLEAWRPFAPRAFGGPIAECGHFIPEEQPGALTAALLEYLA